MARKTKEAPIIPEFGWGERIRKARQHAQLGQKEMAEQLKEAGYEAAYPSIIAFWEKGGRPRGDQWEACRYIEKVTGVDAFWLLTGEVSAKNRCFRRSPETGSDQDFLASSQHPHNLLTVS